LNLKGDVIAFGGRVMDDSLPKYINSPETEVFKKGETLFAINLAKDEIRKKDYAIIVEGYLDAILCHQYGFRNTVAPLGTALTSRQ
jgi:DNA primase